MKRNRILPFIINLLLFCLPFGLMAQKTGKKPAPIIQLADTASKKAPLFRGIMVGVNIADPVLRAFGQDYGGYEGSVEFNLKNRFFPEVSLGIGEAKTTTDRDFHYVCKPAFYGRVGMHYNFQYRSDKPNFFVLSLRYGFSSYKADITNLYYDGGFWDPAGPFDLKNQKFNSHWLEFGGGIRVKIFRNFYMGWMVYYKALLKEGSTEYANPWYIPGYGANGKGLGFSYNLYYNIPFFK